MNNTVMTNDDSMLVRVNMQYTQYTLKIASFNFFE